MNWVFEWIPPASTPPPYESYEPLPRQRTLGHQHDISAGLVIGGKDKEEEAHRISRMNVLVCTPGRLLQHLDETAGFECGGLQVRVP